jgi:hypothetical protein
MLKRHFGCNIKIGRRRSEGKIIGILNNTVLKCIGPNGSISFYLIWSNRYRVTPLLVSAGVSDYSEVEKWCIRG